MSAILSALAIKAGLLMPIQVEGEGYFRFIKEGNALYAKKAKLTIADGQMVNEDGTSLLPKISVSKVPDKLMIDPEGRIHGYYGSQKRLLGRLTLAYFNNPKSLSPVGNFWISKDRPILKQLGIHNADHIEGVHLNNPSKSQIHINHNNPVTVKKVLRDYSDQQYPRIKNEVHAKKILSQQQQNVMTKSMNSPEIQSITNSNNPVTVRTVLRNHNHLRKPQMLYATQINKDHFNKQQKLSDYSLISNQATIYIKVKAVSEVETDTFALGEIAEIEADDNIVQQLSIIPLGDTPALGVQRGINKYQIESRLKMANINLSKINISIPSLAIVKRIGQKIEHMVFVHKALEALKNQSKEADPNIPAIDYVSESPYNQMIVPMGQLELIIENVQYIQRKAHVTIAAYVDSKRINARTIVLAQKSVPKVLQPNSMVQVKIRSNGVMVETNGQIKEAAGIGEFVNVAIAPNVILRGQVINGNLIEVQP